MPQHFKLKIRRGARHKWTPEKKTLAADMRRAGSSNDEISRAVGMCTSSISDELWDVERPTGPRRYATREARDIPDATLNERDHRQASIQLRNEQFAHRGNLSFLIGDLPPPGRSALDRMKGRGVC